MPKTVWRPYPRTFVVDLNKFENAVHRRQQVIDYLRSVDRPVTARQIAEALQIGGKGYYGKVRRYVVQVADPTHDIYRPRRRPDIGWTLKPEYK